MKVAKSTANASPDVAAEMAQDEADGCTLISHPVDIFLRMETIIQQWYSSLPREKAMTPQRIVKTIHDDTPMDRHRRLPMQA